jgi:anti-sigma B factor antagonist
VEYDVTLCLKVRRSAGIAILDMSGQLAIGQPVLLLRSAIQECLLTGTANVILNLGEVTYIDSAGLGELIRTYTSCRRGSGQAKLLNLTETAKELLRMTKLLTEFDCYDNEVRAVEAFGRKDDAAVDARSHRSGRRRGRCD